MTITETLVRGTTLLKIHRIDSPGLDAALLLAETLALSREQLILRGPDPLPESVSRRFFHLIDRRIAGECTAYILGRKEFRGLNFLVNPAVLVPRPDTETLVETALAGLGVWNEELGAEDTRIASGSPHAEPSSHSSLLDLCTGSGAVAIALKYECPELEVFASDLSPEALKTARLNAARLLGTEPNTPGTELNASGTELNASGTELNALGTEPNTPGTELNTPGTELNAPGTEPNASGTELNHFRRRKALSPNALGTEPNAPGTELNTPGTEPNASGTELNTPGTEPNTPGTELNTPGTEPNAPGTELDHFRRRKALSPAVTFIHSDLFDRIPRRFHLITANPPYVKTAEIRGLPPEVRREPRLALDGGKDGLDLIRSIISQSPDHLFPGGLLLLEADPRQMPLIVSLLEQQGFLDIQTYRDLSGMERVIGGRFRGKTTWDRKRRK